MTKLTEIYTGRVITRSVVVSQSINEVFAFFSDATNLEILTPHWLHFKILSCLALLKIGKGTLIDYKLKVKGIPIRWRSESIDWKPPYLFVDRQVKGPYEMWVHTHRFSETNQGTLVEDLVFTKFLEIVFLGNV